ncbi:MAG: presqualene diphosphate synthase HpnD [Calditrichia bacterium]
MSKSKKITRNSKSNFYYAFSVLPREKREAIYTLYAFCRQTDDIADSDQPHSKKQLQLDIWEEELLRQFSGQHSHQFQKVWKIADRFRIPIEYFMELIKGVRMDLARVRFQSFDDLMTYCYRVASVVGLMSIQIFGYRDERVKEYAVNLGIALQLTNIMRDVGVDAEMGRLYLPIEELNRFGVTEQDILNKRNNPAFQRLMRHQFMRAREYYDKASEILPRHERRNMIPSQIMKNIYAYLLHSMARNQFNVMYHKLEIPTFVKLSIAFRTLFTESLQIA